jgi:hypothetical protein
MTTNHPCTSCGSPAFYRRENVTVHASVAGARSKASDLKGTLMICAACGRAELFMRDAQTWAQANSAELVRVGPAAPYR